MTTFAATTALYLQARPDHRTVSRLLRGLFARASTRLHRGLSRRAVLDLDDRLRADIGLPPAVEEPDLRLSRLIGW